MASKKYLKCLVVVSIAGLILSFILLTQHYRFKEGIVEKSFCSITEYVDCDLVNQSRYSEISGIPVSGLAFIYFLLGLIFFVRIHSSPDKKEGLMAAQFLSWGALILSLVMTYLSLFKIKALCILCLGIVACNGLIVFLIPASLSAVDGKMPAVLRQYFGKGSKIFLHIVLIALVFGGGILWMKHENRQAVEKRILSKIKNRGKLGFDPTRPPSDQIPLKPEDIIDLHFKQPPAKINPGNRPRRGSPSAPVVVLEFSDFECPFCGRAADYLKSALAAFGDDVVFYFAHYPLDQSCNPHVKHKMHENACRAAKAAICAGFQGKFWTLHDLFFDHQQELTKDNLKKYVSDSGLDPQQIFACVGQKSTQDLLIQDVNLGKALGVEGTPTVFVNGRHLQAWSHPDILKGVIEEELSK